MSQHISDGSRAGVGIHPRGESDVNVVQDGPADAPALLGIHGLAGSAVWWEPMVPTLARDFRVIRVDLLGHGRSPSPRHGYDTAKRRVLNHPSARRVCQRSRNASPRREGPQI